MKTNTRFFRAALGLLAVLLTANLGWGYTYILSSSSGQRIRWPFTTSTVPLRLMLGASSTALTDHSASFDASVLSAAQTWNAVMGTIQFAPTIINGTPGDGNRVNELAFATTVFGQAFDSTTLAITTTWTSTSRGSSTVRRTEADTIFNSNKTWDSYTGNLRSGVQDIHRVALHELGHALGLDHPDEATPPQGVSAVMNSHVSNIDTLTMDDIAGIQNIYGPPGPPANDNFANATSVILTNYGATVNGFNTLATKETNEPAHASNAGTGGHSVWWRWSATADGTLTVDTKGSYFDTTMGAYTGSTVGALTTIGANDDINAGIVQASTLTFNVTTGTVYYIAVDGYDNEGVAETGGITLNYAFTPSGGTLATITTQPANVATTSGLNATFSVVGAAGNNPISYQWLFNGTPILGPSNAPNSVAIANASGVNTATLSLSSVLAANAGSYSVTLSTAAGIVTSSSATLAVSAPAVVTPTPAPSSGGGGGGGGGAPSLWFLFALGSAGLARLMRRR